MPESKKATPEGESFERAFEQLDVVLDRRRVQIYTLSALYQKAGIQRDSLHRMYDEGSRSYHLLQLILEVTANLDQSKEKES